MLRGRPLRVNSPFCRAWSTREELRIAVVIGSGSREPTTDDASRTASAA